jgi:hypothetical protein
MTTKTRLDRLEKAAHAAHGLAVVCVGRGETPAAAKARAGIGPDYHGQLVIVNRG